MKKSFAFLIFLLLFSNLVQAENETEKNLTKLFSEVKSEANLTTFDEFKTNITLPNYIQTPTKIIFQLDKEKDLELEFFIVLLAVFIILATMISSIIEFTPIHREPLKLDIFILDLSLSWDFIFGILVTLIIAISGTINFLTSEIFSLSASFEFIRKMGVWSTVLIVVAAIILFVILKMITRQMRNKFEIEKSRLEGNEVRRMNDSAKINADATNDLANSK